MQTCTQMQKVITHLATRFGLDLNLDEAHLKLENSVYAPLVIEKVGRSLLSVAHYFEQNGDLVADPEVVFFTGCPNWVPVEITQPPPAGYRVCAEVAGDAIARVDPRRQADVARFVEDVWARKLEAQGWLERARRAEDTPVEPEGGKYPVLEHMGATAFIAQAVFAGSLLYHAVLIGHQVALKALRAALAMRQYLALPDTGQNGSAHHSVTRIEEVLYHSRVVGDQERGLYIMAVWADNRHLLEKGRCFYLVDPTATPAPILEYDYGSERPALPLPSPEVLARFYAWLNEALLTPLQEGWAGRLWEEGSRMPAWSPLVNPAMSFGCAAWIVRVDESDWEEIVKQVLRK